MPIDTNIPTTLEKQFVEAPFLQQLESMAPLKWEVLRLDRWGQTEAETGRTSWIQPVMMKELEDSIIRLNPWLEQNQIHDAVHDITTFQSDNLITSNKNILITKLEYLTLLVIPSVDNASL